MTASNPTIRIRPTVNGRATQITIEPRELLASVLRDRLGLTGTKLSCDQQVCGACTILVDGLPVSSCTMLAIDIDERTVTTIEGLADGQELHPVQRAFLEQSAFQCGFCTPGMILASVALLAENPKPSERDVREWLEGNICRCTGYVGIVDAVLQASREGR